MVQVPQRPHVFGCAAAPPAWQACATPSRGIPPKHVQPLPQTNHTRANRTCIFAPSEADQRSRDCPFDEFAAGRAGLPRSVRHCTALHWQAAPAAWARQPMLPNPAAPPHHQDFTPEQAASGRAQPSDKEPAVGS